MSVSFTEAIYMATAERLKDSCTHVLGLGATYPNGLDGTMKDLAARYPNQVHDTPCSESCINGIGLGASINGLLPIIHHGRTEFALYGIDQIVTQASKWNYMFGGDYPCPLTFRIAMGRQWGNGPQHTLTAKGIFAVPGLCVVAPSRPVSAYRLLLAAATSNKPVIYLESRWLYKTTETVHTFECASHNDLFLLSAVPLTEGTDITIVAVADMVLESLRAAKLLATIGISAEVVDLVSVYPLDYNTIHKSVKKTGRLLVVDASTPAYSVAHEVLSQFNGVSLTCPDTACPTSPKLTANYYPTDINIANCAAMVLASPKAFENRKTFAQLNLPPTDNFDTLLAQ